MEIDSNSEMSSAQEPIKDNNCSNINGNRYPRRELEKRVEDYHGEKDEGQGQESLQDEDNEDEGGDKDKEDGDEGDEEEDDNSDGVEEDKNDGNIGAEVEHEDSGGDGEVEHEGCDGEEGARDEGGNGDNEGEDENNSHQENEQDTSAQMDVDKPISTCRSIHLVEQQSQVDVIATSSVNLTMLSSSSRSKKRKKKFTKKHSKIPSEGSSLLLPSSKNATKLNHIKPSLTPGSKSNPIDVDLFALSSIWEPDNLELLVSHIEYIPIAMTLT